MKAIGNLIWVIFGGAVTAAMWCLYGILWCCTIIGIPLGKQCFKFARLSFMPFDKEVRDNDSGVLSTIANIIWIVSTGAVMAFENLCIGLVFCVTIVGIPFGKQYFKLAKLALAPFGFEVVKK
ncbi:MAG: YccF domain-containing protein [Clostridia bacterium]|nr:YccF domain-containing protein [Clostridia bacterium]